MSRSGSNFGLLDQLHAEGCDGKEFCSCQPVVVPQGRDKEPHYADRERGAGLEVVFMAWCSGCGAAEWEVV